MSESWKVFTAGDFQEWYKAVDVANARVAPLLAEIARLRAGYLADENGNEYVAVTMLKEKIKEQEAQLAALHAEITAAPVLYACEWAKAEGQWSTRQHKNDTHTCRAVHIAKLETP